MSRRDYNNEWAHENRERKRAISKKYTSSEKYKATRRAYFGRPEPTRPMPDACECCGRLATASAQGTLALDHNHTSGAFRGWLCNRCNAAIGLLGDGIDGLLQAVAYINRADLT